MGEERDRKAISEKVKKVGMKDEKSRKDSGKEAERK
jgi:hypothetical protein